jgi:membrane-associated phospholipid phosphatase
MSALTDFGDLAVTLPLSVVVLAWLLCDGSRRGAGLWAIAVGVCISFTALLKVYFYVCPPTSDLVSPSGHTSLSVLSYGGIALVVAAEQRGWLRAPILASGAILIASIAGSRLWLKAHSVPEVVIGIGIGIATLTFFANGYLRSRTEGKRFRPLIVSTIIVITVLHGQELRAEALLHGISRYFLSSSVCMTNPRAALAISTAG